MFVKIICHTDNGTINSVLECVAAKLIGDSGANEKQLTLELERGTVMPHRSKIDKTTMEVYYMNDTGDTIDTFRWRELQEDRQSEPE